MKNISNPNVDKAEENEKEYVKPSALRRFIAFLLDFVLLIIMTGIVYTIITRPIATSLPSYKNAYQDYKDYLCSTTLYESHDVYDYILIYENSEHDFYYIDDKLNSFYESHELKESYLKMKLDNIEENEQPLFYIDEAHEYQPIAQKVDSDEMKTWLRNAVDKAVKDVIENDEQWIQKATLVSELLIQQLSVTLIIVSLIFYLIMPLVFKGPTIGKKLMGLCLYNFKKKDCHPSSVQLLLRYFFFVLIELLIGIYTLFLIPIISFICGLALKKGQTFHDFLSATSVIEYHEMKTNPDDSFSQKAMLYK